MQARVLVQAYMYMQVYTQKAAARHDYYRKKKYSHVSLLGLLISTGGSDLISSFVKSFYSIKYYL